MQGVNLTSMDQVVGTLMPFIYLLILGIVLSLVLSLVELFSIDRVLKLVRGRKAFVFLGKEAYYGKLYIPPRSKGGFEVFYVDENIENPESLIAFLIENYQETGNEKFLEKAKILLDYLKKNGLMDQELSLEDIRINSWAPPSLVSRKVYPDELGNLWMIISFVDFMDDEEKKGRWKTLTSLYSKPFLKRTKRKIHNSLNYVKDKLTAAVSSSTSVLVGGLPKDLQKTLKEAEEKTIGAAIVQSYDPLLENSIGRLVTVRVDDVEGERKLYQGVLGEYSDKYLYVLDVDYRLQILAKVSNGSIVSAKPIVEIFGRRVNLGTHLEVIEESNATRIKNIWGKPIKVEKVIAGDNEVNIGKVLFPGEETSVDQRLPSDYLIHYEIALESDVIWPRSKAVVVGLGDYPPRVLESVLGGLEVKDLLKKII